ncbi:MAG: tetratricopeptide repeat protein [Leptospira sp.]|nr:tetratricopeptide repeat protein [Leptospira sp.]
MNYLSRSNYYFTTLILILLFPSISPVLSQIQEDELVFAFRGYHRTKAERMVVVGEVVSIEKAELLESEPSPDLNLDTRPDNVVVKVLNPKGVRVGQTLYLVEKDPNHKKFRNGNVVGQIKVRSIFDTTFFGKQLRGEGFTKLIENRPMTVVRLLESADTKEALVLKKKGDAASYQGNYALAMKEYRQSIAMDAKLPDAHFALGKLYRDQEGMGIVASIAEYSNAWKYRANFSETRERYKFYLDYLDLLKNSLEQSTKTKEQNRVQLLRMKEVIEDSKKLVGNKFEPQLYSAWVNYQYFLSYADEPATRSKYWEQAKVDILACYKFQKESLFFHETAILIYQEELGSWVRGRPLTDTITLYMDRIREHGRRLLLINPPGNPINLKVIDVLERIE